MLKKDEAEAEVVGVCRTQGSGVGGIEVEREAAAFEPLEMPGSSPFRRFNTSPKSVRLWRNRLGPIFAAAIGTKRLDGIRACSSCARRVDERAGKINGVRSCP